MIITENYKNAFAEVCTILDYMDIEDYEKIPSDVRDVIEENRNLDYEYEMNEDVDIFNQPMLPETRAILFSFFRDYWATTEQREKIKRMQMEERYKIEEKKKLEYGNGSIFKDNSSEVKANVTNSETKKTALIEVKKESLLTKIIKKIKSFFKR